MRYMNKRKFISNSKNIDDFVYATFMEFAEPFAGQRGSCLRFYRAMKRRAA